MGQMMSVKREQPLPSAIAPPPSYCTGRPRHGSACLSIFRHAIKLGPAPDSLPSDHTMIYQGYTCMKAKESKNEFIAGLTTKHTNGCEKKEPRRIMEGNLGAFSIL